MPLPMPPEDSVWRCPCGYQGSYSHVRAHRKGHKKRPACAVGPMRPIDPELLTQEARLKDERVALEHAEQMQEAQEQESPPFAPFDDFIEAADDDEDPEALARMINERGGIPKPFIDGFQDDDPFALPPDSDWTTEPGDLPTQPTRDTLQVAMPVEILVWYDWSRKKGWGVGAKDQSLSAWLTELVYDYFHNVFGVGLFILPLSEVDNGGSAGNIDGGFENVTGANLKT